MENLQFFNNSLIRKIIIINNLNGIEDLCYIKKSDLKKMFVDYQCYYGGNKSKRKMDELKFNLFIKDFYEHGYSFIDERSILEKKLIKTK